MFPDKLDGAKVLFYTPKGDYGVLFNERVCVIEAAHCNHAGIAL